MQKAFFTGGLRTAFGRAQKGAFAETRPDELLIALLEAHQQKYKKVYEKGLEDLLVGCAYPQGEQGFNLARMVALGSGLEIPAATTTRLCASSLDVVASAAGRIRSGLAEKILVAGVESLSRVGRRGADFQESERIKLASPNAYMQMGETAEIVADRTKIPRGRQEEFSARSHELADQAFTAGFYRDQIFTALLAKDEGIRVPVSLEKMATLKPVFRENGLVTAATSSPLSDGACTGFVLSENEFKNSDEKFALEIVDVTWSHVAPEIMGMGPVPAIQTILQRNSLKIDDIAAIEINEAFAVQALACMDELKLPAAKVNAKGGAIAIGHPLGASGLRLLMTLQARLCELGSADALGIATLCVGGGQGMAILCRFTSNP